MTMDTLEPCSKCGSQRGLSSDRYCRNCGAEWAVASTIGAQDVTHTTASVQSQSERLPAQDAASTRLGLRQILPVIAVITLLAAAVIGDRLWWHIYSPDVSALESRLQAAENTESHDYLGLDGRVTDVESAVRRVTARPTPSTFSLDQFLVNNRIANAVAILSLVQAYGGFQSSGSAAGEACVDYLVSGTGSVTDCGFQRVSN